MADNILADYLDRDQLAAELGVSPRTIARWHTLDEAPPCVRFGRSIRYRKAAVKAWLEAREDASAA